MKWNVLNRKPKVYSTAIEEMRREVEEIAENWDTGSSIICSDDVESEE